MAASRPRGLSAWPDLASDLLGVVLRRLPSLADRVRLRAVCRPWRSSAATMLHQSPPQLPWLVFHDGTLLDVSNNTTHRARLPDAGAICYCAGESTLFLLHDDGRCSLMNAFSSDVTPLPELAVLLKSRGVKSTEIVKVVMSYSPTKLVAVLTSSNHGCGCSVFSSTCRPAGETNSCQVLTADRFMDMICDIAIFQGSIHAISKDNRLFSVELNHHHDRTPLHFVTQIDGDSILAAACDCEVQPYLVKSNGKLLVVWRWVSKNWVYKVRTRRLVVVEADLSRGLWDYKVDGLDGQALFVSMLCSKSVSAADAGAGQDCIYFPHEYKLEGWVRESCAYRYSMGDRTITPLMPGLPNKPLPWDSWQACPAWFFPIEV